MSRLVQLSARLGQTLENTTANGQFKFSSAAVFRGVRCVVVVGVRNVITSLGVWGATEGGALLPLAFPPLQCKTDHLTLLLRIAL